MRLTIAEPRYFKDSVSIISELVNEARFKVTKDGLELVAMDPANVAMVVFKLLSSSFTEYDIEEEIEISINFNNLKQILRRAGPSDVLTLEMTSDNKLQIQLKDRSVRTFSIPIIEFEEREQKIPNLEFPVTIRTHASTLNNAVEDADIVAESVTFIAEPKKFIIQAEGDLNKARIEIKESEDTRVECSEKTRAKYSIEYLKKMMGGSKISDNVVIQFSKDYPLRLEYKAVNRVQLVFILAPRVEND